MLETPERPEHPMDFIRANLGASQVEERRIATLEQEVIGYKKEVSELKTQLEAVKSKLKEFEQKTDVEASGDANNDEKPSATPVAEIDAKEGESKQINGGGAEADVNKDKTITESEKAATPSSTAATVDSAKTSNESENADVAKSTNTSSAKADDDKPNALATDTASDETNKSKTSENAATAPASVAVANATENDK